MATELNNPITLNHYTVTPEGSRVRWMPPVQLMRRTEVYQGQKRLPGVAYIDQWLKPEPPEAA